MSKPWKDEFKTMFWDDKVKNFRNNQRVAIVNGWHFTACLEDETGELRGYGGKKFVIQFNDGRTIETTNLWCQGVIPQEYRHILSDNAIFVGDSPYMGKEDTQC